jgi:hypothetical protein
MTDPNPFHDSDLEPKPNRWDRDLFAEVPGVPLQERLRWGWKVGVRYVGNILFYTPQALVYGLRHPNVELLGDREFEERFDNTVFNKMVVSCDAPDAAAFARQQFPTLLAESTDSTVRYFIADFSIFETLTTFPGTYAAGTTVLFGRDRIGARLDVIAIRIKGMELTPADGDAWALAKLFAIQGATIRLVFGSHAMLHFPEDSINAIAKARLPPNHVLYQLLIPHLDLQLTLDNTVLSSPTSPLINNQIFPWNAHTGPVDSLIRSVRDIYVGVENNPAYCTYSYKHPRRNEEEKYLIFLEAYYQTILRFVQKVLTKIVPGDEHVKRWADQVAQHVPGFPTGDAIFVTPDKPGFIRNLDWAVATLIWDVSVGHTTDHYNMGQLDINQNPMRVRVPPPESRDARFDRRQLGKWSDFFRYRLFWKMFLRSTTVLRLDDVRYPFADPELVRYNDEFLRDLATTARTLEAGAFIPLRDIARSIQF